MKTVHGVQGFCEMSNGDWLRNTIRTVCTGTLIQDEKVYSLYYTFEEQDITCPDCILKILGDLP